MARRWSTSLQALVPDLAKGLRAAIAICVPFYLAVAWHRPELRLTALGGWLGTLADPGGARWTRAKALTAFALAGGAIVPVFEAATKWPWLGIALLGLASFGLPLLAAVGGAAGSVGRLLLVAAVVADSRAQVAPVRDGLLFALGAVNALVLSSVVWPIWTHLPVRRAIGGVYRELADYASQVRAAIEESVPQGDPRWSAIVRLHHLRIRAAIESARDMALAVRARHAGETRFGGNVRALLGASEAQFPILAALVEEIEAVAQSERAETQTRLARVESNDRQVERVLVTPGIRSAPRLPTLPHSLPPAAGAHALASRLESATRDALCLASTIGESGAASTPDENLQLPRERTASSWLQRVSDPLRSLGDAMSPRSVHFRHSLRVAIAAIAAAMLGAALSPTRAYWVTLTAVVILQPHAGPTIKRAGERILGTVFGCVVAAVIAVSVQAPLALALLMVPLSVAAVATRPYSYRLFTFFLTPVFVLLATRYSGDWWTAAARAGDATLGGLVALVVIACVFPSSERDRLPDALAVLFETAASHAAIMLAFAVDPARGHEAGERIAATRRTAGIAFGAAEASLERYLAEPLRDDAFAQRAVMLVTYTRRLSTTLASLNTIIATTSVRLPEDTVALASAYFADVLSFAARRARGNTEGIAPVVPTELVDDLSAPIDATLARAVRWGELVASGASGLRRPTEADLAPEIVNASLPSK